MVSPRGRAPDGKREWREGLLREAVTTSFTRSPGGENEEGDTSYLANVTGRSSKRLPIPAHLLDAAPIKSRQMIVEVEQDQDQDQDQAIDAVSL
jgi:hypothetical protein